MIAMAEGWVDATDVFRVFLPWKFTREESGETVRYRSEDPALDISFTGAREADLPGDLLHPEIGLAAPDQRAP
ncbi:hypothetical protein [Nocardia sp. NRRL S-836]|uniref:hypothetical protein n=1 Tax=Nocardia sp. NRRL S-836 TaxID=1519492 RepID=UPI0006AEF078|nr:hypothetical protein [Nocardia sp. NRRL S-836]KOV81469.1 hypothetical protein ADL03_29000 [Nocardia sp. NRRL S-836]